jgi:pimeloyl-ACP methyl ester carboxylesterase
LVHYTFPAIALDTPGYGLSDPPPSEREIPDYAAALLEAVDGLGVGRFAVAGVHTGASLALQVALQAGPGRVSHVVFSGLPLLSAEERAEYLRSWSPPMAPAADGSHLRWAWERYERIWQGPPDLLHLGATLLLGNLERYHWAYNAAFRYDPRPDLGGLSCPVLFLTAEGDLLIRSDREALALVPGSRLVEVPGLVGQLPLRAPETFSDALLAFLAGPGRSGQS